MPCFFPASSDYQKNFVIDKLIEHSIANSFERSRIFFHAHDFPQLFLLTEGRMFTSRQCSLCAESINQIQLTLRNILIDSILLKERKKEVQSLSLCFSSIQVLCQMSSEILFPLISRLTSDLLNEGFTKKNITKVW